MPWPVYLACKHLFPTGRGLTLRAVGKVLRITLIVSAILFAVLLGFLWWRGVLARLHLESPSVLALAGQLGLVWLWLALAVFMVTFIFHSTPFFNAMSIFGIVLGVTVLITVQSVMNGFANEYVRVFIETQGHLNVFADEPMKNSQQVANLVKQVPGVTLAEPVAEGLVMLLCNNLPSVPQVRSFDMNNPDTLRDPLVPHVVEGKFSDLDDHSVLLGRGQAEKLHASVGSKVEVYSLYMLESSTRDDWLRPQELTVAGIFDTGFAMYDDNTIGVTLRTMQELYGFTDEVGSIEVRLDNDDTDHLYQVQAAVEKALIPVNQQRLAAGDSPIEVQTWEERNHEQLQILFVEKSVMFYIMIVIVIVAAFCILCSLATSVVRKTREIGVLGALGARPTQIAAVFCLQGLIIGAVGALLGVSLSLLLLHFRQVIVNAFVDQHLIVEFYNFYSFPAQYRLLDFARIIGFTFCITTLAGLLPAWWAARLKPAECLRYE
jgi:lipoprotein-releasing system permease protein